MVYKKYSYKHGKVGASAQTVGETLERIEQRDGAITKEAFLEESRPKDSPTHNMFEWDDTVAAEKYRLEQSRLIIADVVVTIERDEEPKKVAGFVNVTYGKHNKAEYNSIDVAMQDDSKRNAILANAFEELKAFEIKYGEYSELAGIFAEAHKAERLYNHQN